VRWNKNLTLQSVIALLWLGVLAVHPMQLEHPFVVMAPFLFLLLLAFMAEGVSQLAGPGARQALKTISVSVGVILAVLVCVFVGALGLLAAWNAMWTPKR
jgi:hypothetical protein